MNLFPMMPIIPQRPRFVVQNPVLSPWVPVYPTTPGAQMPQFPLFNSAHNNGVTTPRESVRGHVAGRVLCYKDTPCGVGADGRILTVLKQEVWFPEDKVRNKQSRYDKGIN